MGGLADDPVIKLLVENHWSISRLFLPPRRPVLSQQKRYVHAHGRTCVHARAWGVPTLPNLALQHCKYLNVMFCLSIYVDAFSVVVLNLEVWALPTRARTCTCVRARAHNVFAGLKRVCAAAEIALDQWFSTNNLMTGSSAKLPMQNSSTTDISN